MVVWEVTLQPLLYDSKEGKRSLAIGVTIKRMHDM
jgi:hypothetical protein